MSISIHALREEGDEAWAEYRMKPNNFYPRPPRGGRPELILQTRAPGQFLSTPSARRATWYIIVIVCKRHISIHALREEGDGIRSPSFIVVSKISIHALREEGDTSFLFGFV